MSLKDGKWASHCILLHWLLNLLRPLVILVIRLPDEPTTSLYDEDYGDSESTQQDEAWLLAMQAKTNQSKSSSLVVQPVQSKTSESTIIVIWTFLQDVPCKSEQDCVYTRSPGWLPHIYDVRGLSMLYRGKAGGRRTICILGYWLE